MSRSTAVRALALAGLCAVSLDGLSLAAVASTSSPGLLVTSVASGVDPNANTKLFKLMMRCIMRELPSGEPLHIYLPPPHSESLEAVLDGVLKWSEYSFEKQRSSLEQRAGRRCYFHKDSDSEVLESLLTDPGGIGVVSSSTALSEDIIVLWPPSHQTAEAAPSEAAGDQ